MIERWCLDKAKLLSLSTEYVHGINNAASLLVPTSGAVRGRSRQGPC